MVNNSKISSKGMSSKSFSRKESKAYLIKKYTKLLLALLALGFLISFTNSSRNLKQISKDDKITDNNYSSNAPLQIQKLRLLQSDQTQSQSLNLQTSDPFALNTTAANNESNINSSNKTETLENQINNFLTNYYEDYPQVGIYSIKLNNTNVINNIQFTTQTKIDFFDEKRKNDFSLDLSGNLIKFLGEFFTSDLTQLSLNEDYKKFISQNYQKRTILIGIDGMVTSCIDFQSLSAFKFLIENGSHKLDSRSTTEGLSGPGWSSVLCSLSSKDTGIVNNEWKAPWSSPENKSKYNFFTPIKGLDTSFPCLFGELKKGFLQKQNLLISPNSENAVGSVKNFTNFFYSSWSFFRENFSHKAYPHTLDLYAECQIRTNQSYFEYINCDNYSLDKTKNFLLQDFDLYFWYLGSLDVAGHTFSFCSTEYQSRVENINSILDDFFSYLKTLDLLDKINIIITSDHGADRGKMSHGKDKYDGNLMVPLFMMGPDFKKNYTITEVTRGLDIAPTIMKIYEFPVDDIWRGKVIYEALKISDSYSQKTVAPVVEIGGDFIRVGFLNVKSLFGKVLLCLLIFLI